MNARTSNRKLDLRDAESPAPPYCMIWRMYCTEILCSRKVAMINKLSTSSQLYNRTGRWGDSQRSIVGSIISVVAQ